MATRDKARNALNLAAVLIENPSETRHILRWRSELRRPTLESSLPWLPFSLVAALESLIRPGTRVFEYGGGGSTLWFAARGASVHTVEHDPEWAEVLRSRTLGLGNVHIVEESDPSSEAYVNAITPAGDAFDVVVVDGRERVRCFEAAMPHVAPNGWLILDDTDRAKYAGVRELAAGWSAEVYRGLAPFKPVPAHSTAWRRPGP